MTKKDIHPEAVGGPGGHAGSDPLTRRRLLKTGAAAGVVSLAGAGGAAAQAQGAAATPLGWAPRFLDAQQARLLERLCDLLLPRTTTPGALDAGVPEWIDLALSLDDPDEQLETLGGLAWIDQRSREISGKPFLGLSASEQTRLLGEISDEHASHPPELRVGAAFFAVLKRRALFAYFTSEKGRVEALGLPAKVRREIFRGCPHPDGTHSA